VVAELYLSGRSQFVQIDDKSSSRKPIHFGIPQGSILGPLIFNLCVADLNDVISSHTNCYQYADDTKLSNWSQGSNLALNPTKTKCMLFTTSQMSTYHSLSSRPLQLAVEGKALERVKSTKLLGVHLKENLKWDVHVKHHASTCYGTLANLRKILTLQLSP
jgi:hypothetical protein